MNLKQELVQLKQQLETKYVVLHNDGTVTEINSKQLEKSGLWKPFDGIIDEVKEGYERFARYGSVVDSLNLGMDLGVIYNPEDVEDQKIKEGAEPISSLIYYCSTDLDVYTPEGAVDSKGFNEYRVRHYGFMKFNEFIARAKKEGLDYSGPKSFEELNNGIQQGNPFDINLSIGLTKEQEEIIEEVKEDAPVEESPVQETTVVKKRRFFR